MPKKRIRQVHHVIRYFLMIGIIAFIGHFKRWHDEMFMLLVGPPIYIAYNLKKLIMPYLGRILPAALPDAFVFVLPVTLFYFFLVGFMLKQLWSERGKIRVISLAAFVLFIVYIHYKSGENLLLYLQHLE